jgi:proline dehydrogenase
MSTSLLHRLLIAPLPHVPQSMIWQLSQRYIAGTDLASAYQSVTALNELGCKTTIDVLGEDSTTVQEVETARDLYLAALAGINKRELDCNASIKLSDMGLRFDVDLCSEVMQTIVATADQYGNFIRIDMEDSSVTSTTLDIYRQLRERFDNVGTVIQSCLHRSADDIRSLLDAGIAHLRLCKGIYVEPQEIAYTDADDIRNSYMELLQQLFEGGATKVGIATHDPLLVEFAEKLIAQLNIDKSRYEFQMLLGVAGTMRSRLVSAGHPLRVYVPFGDRWHAYSMRRLRENPGIAMHIIRNLFTRH